VTSRRWGGRSRRSGRWPRWHPATRPSTRPRAARPRAPRPWLRARSWSSSPSTRRTAPVVTGKRGAAARPSGSPIPSTSPSPTTA
jgi:hypothetical protein